MANLLTTIRLLLAVPVALAFANAELVSAVILIGMVAVAVLSDYLDGKVARATGTSSAKGQIFDHGTDFLFVTSGLIGCAINGNITPILPALIVIAFSQYVLDSYYLYRQKELRMNYLGRWNGVLYFGPLFVVAFSRLELGRDFTDFMEFVASIFAWILLASTGLSIIDRTIAPFTKKTN
mgnify:CR=1 FL=1